MTDYIDREKAYKAIKNEMESWIGGDKTDYRYVQDAIADIPAADVRPVVLCKQCSLWCKDESKLKKTAVCSHWSNLEDAVYIYTNENDFCSYGEEVEE